MNIFVTSLSPTRSAKFLDNKRLVKMVLETAQLLSTALRYHGSTDDVYKATHVNHPASIWVRQNKSNYKWLLAHFRALNEEYTRRYGKIHKSSSKWNLFKNGINLLPAGKRTMFANCAANSELNLNFKHLPVLEAYKKYLYKRFTGDKKPALCNWSYSETQ